VDQALRLATRDGLEGISIGSLADATKMSKSGLFAHFGSKEDLQCVVLREFATRFEDKVLRAAFAAPRGEPRVRALFDRWIAWLTDPALPGGCLFLAAATELDDREGPPRDVLVESQRALAATIARSARLAVEEGHFRKDLDPEQFAFELFSIIVAYNHARRLMRDARAGARAKAAFARLLADAKAVPVRAARRRTRKEAR